MRKGLFAAQSRPLAHSQVTGDCTRSADMPLFRHIETASRGHRIPARSGERLTIRLALRRCRRKASPSSTSTSTCSPTTRLPHHRWRWRVRLFWGLCGPSRSKRRCVPQLHRTIWPSCVAPCSEDVIRSERHLAQTRAAPPHYLAQLRGAVFRERYLAQTRGWAPLYADCCVFLAQALGWAPPLYEATVVCINRGAGHGLGQPSARNSKVLVMD